MENQKISCPKCGRRLFDVADKSSGTVIIKCPRCKTLVSIDIKAREPDQRQESAIRAESSR